MGQGEPLMNYANLKTALEIFLDENGDPKRPQSTKTRDRTQKFSQDTPEKVFEPPNSALILE